MKQIKTKQITTYATDFKQKGFTIIEMMIVVAILGVIAAIAVPNMSRQLAENRIKQAERLILNAHRDAQAKAMILRKPILLSFIVKNGKQEGLTLTVDGESTPFARYDFAPQTRIVTSGNRVVTSGTSYYVRVNNRISYKKGVIRPGMNYFICDANLTGNTRIHIRYVTSATPTITPKAGNCPNSW